MVAVEFQARVNNGTIEIPEPHRDQFHGEVRVILVSQDTPADEEWSVQNRRRWQLIAKRTTEGLSDEETRELARLDECAESQLTKVGPRPVEQLEQLYAELSGQEKPGDGSG